MELSALRERRGDLLGLLESRVDSLVAEIESLRRENIQLRSGAAATSTKVLQAENSNLKLALAKEQQSTTAMLQRMQGILARTQSVAQDTPHQSVAQDTPQVPG